MASVQVLSVRTIASTQPGRAGQPATWVMYKHPETQAVRSVFIERHNPTKVEIETAVAHDMRGNGSTASFEFTI